MRKEKIVSRLLLIVSALSITILIISCQRDKDYLCEDSDKISEIAENIYYQEFVQDKFVKVIDWGLKTIEELNQQDSVLVDFLRHRSINCGNDISDVSIFPGLELKGYSSLAKNLEYEFQELLSHCPQIKDLRDDEIRILAQTTIAKNIRPRLSLSSSALKANPVFGPLQECIDQAYDEYRDATTYSLVETLVIGLGSFLIGGTVYSGSTGLLFGLFGFLEDLSVQQELLRTRIDACMILYSSEPIEEQ